MIFCLIDKQLSLVMISFIGKNSLNNLVRKKISVEKTARYPLYHCIFAVAGKINFTDTLLLFVNKF